MEQANDWFANWFDSPYYHILYKHRNNADAQLFIDHLIEFLNPPGDAEMLDLACGRGRHAVYLNSKGFDVTGVDLSAASIAYANQFANHRLHFYEHDMRRLFRANYFDFIFNLFTSFGYFEREQDNVTVLDAVYKALKPGGIIVLDYLNATKACTNLVGEHHIEVEGISFHIHKFIQDGYIIKKIHFSDKGIDYRFEEKVKLISSEQFHEYFKKVNLKILHLFGNYELSPFDDNQSDRLVIVAQKPI